MGLLADYKKTTPAVEQEDAQAVAEFRKMGKTDEQIKRMGYNVPPPPKTGIAKVLEDVKGKYQTKYKEGQDLIRKIPYVGGKIAGINDLAVNQFKRNAEMLSGTARGAVKLAELPGKAGDYVAGKMMGTDESAKTKRQLGDFSSEGMKSLDRSVGLNPDSFSASIGEQVLPMLIGSGAGSATTKLLSQFPKMSALARSSPYLSRTISGAAGNASFETARQVASGEKLSPTTIATSAALSPAFEGLSKGYGALAKSGAGQRMMENSTVTNLLDKTGFKNLLAKVGKGGDDLMRDAKGEIDEGVENVSELIAEGTKALTGKPAKLGEDVMETIVAKIQQKIKPGDVRSQVQQLETVANDIKGSVTSDLAKVTKPEPSPFAKKLLSEIDSFEKNYSPAELSDLAKFKNIKGQWRNDFTASELQEIKALSDKTFSTYNKSGDTLKSASTVASYRKAIKQQIEKMAGGAGFKDIATRNAEIALYKGLAESAKAASFPKRIGSAFVSNPIASTVGLTAGLASVVGTSYALSKWTGLPQGVTMPATAIMAAVGRKVGLSNSVSTKIARNIYEKAGKDSAKGLQMYIKTGKPQYKRDAEKIIRMIIGQAESINSKE